MNYKQLLTPLLFPIIILFVLAMIFILNVNGSIASINNVVTGEYVPSDIDGNFFATLSTYRGEGLYKGFSIVYPPGRFLVMSGLFHILGPSIPTTMVYFNFFGPLLFLIFLYILSYQLFSTFIAKKYAYIAAIIPVFVELTFVRSAQDIHAISALFFIVLFFPTKKQAMKQALLGLLLGLAFLFRHESGIFLLIALLIPSLKNIRNIRIPWYEIMGFSLVWIPVLALILYQGSLYNFFYDLIVMGIITMPKFMGEAISPDLVLLFLSVLILLLSSTLSLFVRTDIYHIRSLALFTALSFISALVRSDEGHLWYGAIWISLYIGLMIISLKEIKKSTINKNALIKTIVISVTSILIGSFLIYIKSSSLYLFVVMALFILVLFLPIKRNWIFIQYGGLIAALVIFHSIAYVGLRYSPLHPTWTLPTYDRALFEDDAHEIGGMTFPEKEMGILTEIQQAIPSEEEYMFIFPDHILYYEFFSQKKPTRYIYFTGERTARTENEVITNIKQTKTHYFLIFSEGARLRGGTIWEWIEDNTIIINTYVLNNKKIELRKIN